MTRLHVLDGRDTNHGQLVVRFTEQNNPIMRLLSRLMCVTQRPKSSSSSFGTFVLLRFHRDWITERMPILTAKLVVMPPIMAKVTLLMVMGAFLERRLFPACLQQDCQVSEFPTRPARRPITSQLQLISHQQDPTNNYRTPVWHQPPRLFQVLIVFISFVKRILF